MNLISTETEVTTTITNKYETKYPYLTVIETIINDNKPHYSVKGEGPHRSRLCFISDNFYEYISKKNPWTYEDWDDLFINKFDSIEELFDLINNDKFVFLYSSGHIIFDHNKRILPYAKTFDYIGTVFNNEVSNLNELLEYLRNHDWVVNKDEIKIENIPYYNCSEDYNEYIKVTILPSREVYENIYNENKDRSGHWSTKMDDYVVGYKLNDEFDPMGLLKFKK